MFDIFGIRARRKALRLAKAQAEKQKYQERKRMIDDYLDAYRRELFKQEMDEYSQRAAEARRKNSVCPVCKSKNVVNRVVRTKGELHGDGSARGDSSGFLFAHQSSFSSHFNIDGKLDTLPVNKCSDCGHEWYIAEAESKEKNNKFYNPRAWLLFYNVKQYLELEYDPYDRTDTCNSLEEKQEAYCKKEAEHVYAAGYRNEPKYMLDYAIFVGSKNKLKHDSTLAAMFGAKHGDDEYSYVMPDHIWEIVKRMIRWEGENTNAKQLTDI